MVSITKNLITITIKTYSPVEDLVKYQKSIYNAAQALAGDDSIVAQSAIETLSELGEELLFDPLNMPQQRVA